MCQYVKLKPREENLPSFQKLPKTIAAMVDCVLNWNEFTFTYGDHEYRVLGGLIGSDRAGRCVLYADLLAVDGVPQTDAPLKKFDLSGSKSPVRKGALRGQCSNDYQQLRATLEFVYAAGPIGRSKSSEGSKSHSEKPHRSAARERIEALFRK